MKEIPQPILPQKSNYLDIFNNFFLSTISEVLKRSTSIVEGLEKLKQGMLLWKIRDKGVRGLKHFPRHYKLDMADLRITYLPNKHITAKNCTAAGAGGAAAIDLGDIAEVYLFSNYKF